jgi:hypothetical protein
MVTVAPSPCFGRPSPSAFRRLACPVSDTAVPKGHPRIARSRHGGTGVGRPSCPARPEGTIESSAEASPSAGGASAVPSGRIRNLCASDPVPPLRDWAIFMKSLRDKGLAELPEGIALRRDLTRPSSSVPPHSTLGPGPRAAQGPENRCRPQSLEADFGFSGCVTMLAGCGLWVRPVGFGPSGGGVRHPA